MKKDAPRPLVLIVDGEVGFSNLLKLRLEEAGYAVETAASAWEAEEKTGRLDVGAFILSAELPDRSGLELYTRLKTLPRTERVPCIFITDRQEHESELKANRFNYLLKPYDPQGMLSRLERAIERSRAPVETTDAGIPEPSPPSPPEIPQGAFETVVLSRTPIEPAAVSAVPPKYVWHYRFMPVGLDGDLLTVAVPDAKHAYLRDDLFQYLGYRIRLVLADEQEIREAIKKHYGVGAETVEKIFAGSDARQLSEAIEAGEASDTDIGRMSQDTSFISLVNQILVDALQKNATDIHIEPYHGKLKLRYRIDGILQDAKVSDHIFHFLAPIVSRIKIMSGLNIVERRLPQDGRSKVVIDKSAYDLRISTLPTPYGESMVIRILPTRMLFGLRELGFSGAELEAVERMLRKPHGVVFVTGPTGSGKSTTLYACLNRIRQDRPGAKIITVEDPIEYEIEGVTQVQVNPDIELTFAKGLRSMLRHDPDIMMVGEVRDFETAEIAIRMSLTGHLLFSTLHTNDAASSATRLIDLGLEPFLVSSSVEAFVAQRLVRLSCRACAARGCEECGGTGYKGRTAIYEVMVANAEIRKLINQKASADAIKQAAVAAGMKTLWDNGLVKVAEGLTTEQELLRVTQSMD